MQDQKIEKIAAVAVKITNVLVIIYLGFIEAFKIGKLLIENLNTEFDISRKWASQNYSILKKKRHKQYKTRQMKVLVGEVNFLYMPNQCIVLVADH